MAWAGGTYTKGNNSTGGWVGDASLGIGIEAGRHDTQDNDFATGINQCLNKDGSNAATGNLNLGGFKYTNAAAATARTELSRVDQVQDGSFIWLGTTAGTATAQTASATPAITAYAAGQKFRMKIGSGLSSTGTTNTSHTLNINSLGAKAIVNNQGSNPTDGTFVNGCIMDVVYDGTDFVITNQPGGWQNYTPTVTANGLMTISALSILDARFLKVNRAVHLQYSLTFTTGGVANTNINITLPVNSVASGIGRVFAAPSYDVAWRVALVQFGSATEIIQLQDMVASNWNLGAGKYVSAFVTYQGV